MSVLKTGLKLLTQTLVQCFNASGRRSNPSLQL